MLIQTVVSSETAVLHSCFSYYNDSKLRRHLCVATSWVDMYCSCYTIFVHQVIALLFVLLMVHQMMIRSETEMKSHSYMNLLENISTGLSQALTKYTCQLITWQVTTSGVMDQLDIFISGLLINRKQVMLVSILFVGQVITIS